MKKNKFSEQEITNEDMHKNLIKIGDVKVSPFVANFATIFLSNICSIERMKKEASSELVVKHINGYREELIRGAVDLFNFYTAITNASVEILYPPDMKDQIEDILEGCNSIMRKLLEQYGGLARPVDRILT